MVLAVLLSVLVLILCIGVGATVVSRLTARIDRLEREVSGLNVSARRHSDSLDTLFDRTEATTDALFAHECKPHPATRKPAAKKAPAKKAATKAAARTRPASGKASVAPTRRG